jgi:pimeloyl-ACP methyl ester carboxylesterase
LPSLLRVSSLATVGAAMSLALVACTSTRSVGPPASLVGSSTGAPASSDSSLASTPAPGSAVASAGGGDGRANPGAFATDLQWTDITKQLSAAIGTTKHKMSYARGSMQVPLNWADTNGKKITLTALRVRSSTQHDRLGSLVINPGGPGASGIDAAISLAIDELPDAVLERFDIVGFDPRGIGLSHPLACIPDKQKDAELTEPADPVTDAQWQASLAEARKVADECYATYGADLTYYSTTETVRDMEALRAKLGDSKLTYLGYSYGTLIGAEYATAYPDKVRALVLDGAVDPTIDEISQDKTQAAGFQLAFSHFAASCTKQAAGCKLGTDPQAFVQKLMAKAAATPIPSKNAKDKRKAGDGAVLLGVISALYDEGQWPTLTTALLDASRGDAAGILALDDQYNERSNDGTYTNIEDANAAIGCADTTQRPSVAQARSLETQWRATNPLFGGPAASSLGFCSLWKAPPDAQITVGDHHAPPVLVIGTTGDPATPISGAQHLAKLLGSGQLLVWQGDGHTAYPKTSCVTDAVDSYLIDLKVPATGKTCPAG